jgi:hypothetical protein
VSHSGVEELKISLLESETVATRHTTLYIQRQEADGGEEKGELHNNKDPHVCGVLLQRGFATLQTSSAFLLGSTKPSMKLALKYLHGISADTDFGCIVCGMPVVFVQ